MTRAWTGRAVAFLLVAAASTAVRADVKTEQKVHFEFGGVIGRMVNLFGGKKAREGVVSMVSVKGDRKMTVNGDTAQLVDLAEEKFYQIDTKDKSYKVVTFDELRRQLEEAQKRAAENARKTEERKEKRDPNAKELEVDFTVKETGQKKAINGFDTHEVVSTITVREKGKTLEQSGGLVLTADMWLAPRMASMKEVADFDLRLYEKLRGPMMADAAEQMAAALAAYPGLKTALERYQKESTKVEGTAILTTVTVDGVQSAEQMQQQETSGGDSEGPKSIGGMFGGLGKKLGKKKDGDAKAAEENTPPRPKGHTLVMTTEHEVLKISPAVTADDVAVPAGFKLKN
jgi:hypothetical protein